MSQKIFESYKWVVPFETGATQGKKVIIRGKALHATISNNLRKYVREELERSARSLAQKYVDVNHEYSIWMVNKSRYDRGEVAVSPGLKPKLKGNVIDSEFEDGFIEYVGEVNDREYVDKLIDRERMTEAEYTKKWGKKPIRCVSVDATYRFHREKDGNLEPHGIIFNGLSLVEDPEVAGVEGTTVEVMEIRETARMEPQFRILQNLFGEMNIITEVVERDGNKVLEGKMLEDVIVGDVKPPVETDEERVKRELVLSDEEWGRLQPATRLNYLQQISEARQKKIMVEKKIEEKEKEEEKEVEEIVKTEEPVKVAKTFLEVRLPLKLEEFKLGETFADYTSFEDCVAKNQDKDDPEAYCSTICKGGETSSLEGKLGDVRREHLRQVMAKSIAHLANRQEASEKKIGETLGKLVKNNTENFKILYDVQNSQIVEGERLQVRIREVADNLVSLKDELGKTFDVKLVSLREEFGKLGEVANKQDLAEVSAKVDALDVDTKIASLDAKISKIDTSEAQMKDIREMFQKYQDDRNKTLTETVNQTKTLIETIEQLKAKTENLEERIKQPNFKVGTAEYPVSWQLSVAPREIKPVGRMESATG